MAKPTIGAAAPPPQEAEPARRYKLPSGEIATLGMLDTWEMMGTFELVPDPITSEVVKLLEAEGSYSEEGDPSFYANARAKERGMIALYSMCRKDKRLDTSRIRGDGANILGRLDVPRDDYKFVYYVFFRAGSAIPLSDDPPAADADRAAQPPSSGGDVPQAAE